MATRRMRLRDLVQALGWSYGTVWSMSNLTTELVFADGCFKANSLMRYGSEYFDVEKLFTSSYRTCAFPLGSGYVGKVLKEGQPLWLNETDLLIHHSNTSSQAHFFKVAGIQTLLCIPWMDSVLELGSPNLLPQNPNLLLQIQPFLSHMATSKQQRANAYFPIESSFGSQDFSAGSDDASFNGGLNRDQQVESCLSLAEMSRSTQHRISAGEHDLSHIEVVAGSGESDWRFDFAADELLHPKNLGSSQQSPSDTFPRQRLQQEIDEEADFDSSFLTCPRQQMPLLSQLEYNHSMSTSNSSSRDGTNNLLSASNGTSEQQSNSNQDGNSNASGNSTPAAGFTPWNRSVNGVQRRSSNSNQVMLQRSIKMAHKIPHMNASRDRQRVAEETTLAANRPCAALDAEEVLSGHGEAAKIHMLAERRRRQKQKENFSSLRALIPFVTKLDRASILGDAISYVKQLTARVEKLEFLNRELQSQLPAGRQQDREQEAQLPGLQRKRSRSSMLTL